MNLSNKVTLVIFSSEGREHLMKQSFPSFLSKCPIKFSKVVLAIDGQYAPDAMSVVGADVVVQNFNRKGYIDNINNALLHVSTPLFFWLEDDFIFNQTFPIEYMIDVMKDDSWAGIFLSRVAPIVESSKVKHYFDNLWLLDFGFSVSPALCNTACVKAAFVSLYESMKGANTRRLGFEPYIDKYFIDNGLKYAVVDPGYTSQVTHIGELESTAREYHMVNSVDEKNSDIGINYLSGFGKEGQITFYNKMGMFAKLIVSVSVLSVSLFWNRKAYDFAFRIYLAYLRRFKY